MSEPVPARGVVLGHGALAEGFVDAVRRITGIGDDALSALSNEGLSPEALAGALRDRVGAGPAIVFTDLPSGSCGFAARRLCNEIAGVVVVGGVNLPVLLEFVVNRDLPPEELVPRLLEKGRAALCCAPVDLEAYGGRALSGR